MWKLNQKCDPVRRSQIKHNFHWDEISTAPAQEIEWRRLRAITIAPRKDRYRAPHATVRKMYDSGLTQKQIAKKLKVSVRTVCARLADIPIAPAEDPIGVYLDVRSAGGARPLLRVKPIPQGSRNTAPSDRSLPTPPPIPPVQRQRCKFATFDKSKRGRDHGAGSVG